MDNSGSRCSVCQLLCTDGNLGTSCRDPVTCICPCNVGSAHDIAQKLAAIAGGAALFAGGTFLSLYSGGTLSVVGSMIASAGASSAFQGAGKLHGKEKISASEYFADVGMGTLTGVVGGGADIATEKIAQTLTANMAKEAYKRGTTKLVVRAAGGAASNVLATAVGEAGDCAMGKKKWEDYGDDPVMWAKAAGRGAFDGVRSHALSKTNRTNFTGGKWNFKTENDKNHKKGGNDKTGRHPCDTCPRRPKKK